MLSEGTSKGIYSVQYHHKLPKLYFILAAHTTMFDWNLFIAVTELIRSEFSQHET